VSEATGVRMILRLVHHDAERVRYATELELTGEAPHAVSGACELQIADGTVRFEGLEAAPPWARDATRALLRTQWRQHPSEWPRRYTRWRAAP
jgi:hypothetical protein